MSNTMEVTKEYVIEIITKYYKNVEINNIFPDSQDFQDVAIREKDSRASEEMQETTETVAKEVSNIPIKECST